MKREGKPVIILGAGEPDFDTPDHVKQAACDAMQRGETKYTALDGIAGAEGRDPRQVPRENGLDYELDEITRRDRRQADPLQRHDGDARTRATKSSSRRPTGPPIPTSSQICRGHAGAGRLRRGGRLPADGRALEAAITPKTRWVMLNSPSNPRARPIAPSDYRAAARRAAAPSACLAAGRRHVRAHRL